LNDHVRVTIIRESAARVIGDDPVHVAAVDLSLSVHEARLPSLRVAAALASYPVVTAAVCRVAGAVDAVDVVDVATGQSSVLALLTPSSAAATA
jgi:hypothetical protein